MYYVFQFHPEVYEKVVTRLDVRVLHDSVDVVAHYREYPLIVRPPVSLLLVPMPVQSN